MLKRTAVLILLFTFLGVASCGPDAPARTAGMSDDRSAAEAAWRAAASSQPTLETYVHPGSDIQFPTASTGFLRLRIVPYNSEKTDIGVGYRWENDRSAVVTVYVYPRPMERPGVPRPFDSHFARELLEVRRGRPDIREIANGISKGNLGGQTAEGRGIEFEFSGGRDFGGARVRSVITVLALPTWLVKYRVTCLVGERDRTLAAVERLLNGLGFPSLGVRVRAGPVRPQ